jgi:hypothetical protein
VQNTTSPASSSDRTFSLFFRRGSNSFAQLVGQSNETYFCNFDLLNGVIGTKWATIRSATMQPFVNEWYVCSVTTRSPITTNYMINLVNSNSIPRGGTPLTNPSATIYVAAPQVEKDAFATSYISTAATAVTRPGDFASIEGNNFSSWYNPVEGTFGSQFQAMFTTDTVPRYILTGNGNQLMYQAANTGTIISFDGQAPVLSESVSAYGVIAKAFLGHSATGRLLTALGVNATSSSTAHNFSIMTLLRIGHLDTVPFYGWIRSLVYYPTRLSDAQIITLSAKGRYT